MNIIVVGLGSMGKRRIRLMKQYDSSLNIYGVDTNSERTDAVKNEYGIQTYASIKDVCASYKIDAGFVCTAPLAHKEIIEELIKNCINVFTEINLVQDGYEKFIDEKSVKLFLSSTFLYRRDIQWIQQKVNSQKVNYQYHTGQYLPDWHPWENYKNFFVGDKRTNGCREILAIELPWIVKCFGNIKKISVLKDTISDLELNYPDNYFIQIEHENGNKGQISVDVVSRKAVRRIQIFNDKLDIIWAGTPASLQSYNLESKEYEAIPTYETIEKDNRYCDNIIENAYMDEIDAFFTWLKGDNSKVLHSFKNDKVILDLIDSIEGEV